MPAMRFAGAALRRRDQTHEDGSNLSGGIGDAAKARLMNGLGVLGNIVSRGNPLSLGARIVLDPAPTAAGTLEEARAKGLL